MCSPDRTRRPDSVAPSGKPIGGIRGGSTSGRAGAAIAGRDASPPFPGPCDTGRWILFVLFTARRCARCVWIPLLFGFPPPRPASSPLTLADGPHVLKERRVCRRRSWCWFGFRISQLHFVSRLRPQGLKPVPPEVLLVLPESLVAPSPSVSTPASVTRPPAWRSQIPSPGLPAQIQSPEPAGHPA